eukprot:c39340_g1_i1 orf=1-528(-)
MGDREKEDGPKNRAERAAHYDTVNVCHDGSTPPVTAQTLDELHSLQRKTVVEDDKRKQQLQSISASLASLTQEAGPKVVRGEPTLRAEPTKFEEHAKVTPTFATDSSLKFTHVLYNLSPAELYEQAIKNEKGSFITSTGALATLSGARTGRSPRDKRVVKEPSSQDDLWWGKGSPN